MGALRARLLGDARPPLKPPPFHEQDDEAGAGEQPPEGAVGFRHGGREGVGFRISLYFIALGALLYHYKSFGLSPVCLAMRESMRGPISSPS